MKHIVARRWRRAGVVLVVAVAALVYVGAMHGWRPALEMSPIPATVVVYYYVMAGRDSDYGAWVRRELDERQRLRWLKIQAFVGRVLGIAVAIVYPVSLATKTTLWPSATMVCVLLVASIAGWFVYAERGLAASSSDH